MNQLFCMMFEGETQNNSLWLIIVMAAFLVLILLTSFIPQKKRQKEMMNMLSNLKSGDEVKTIGGMVGKIFSINEETGLLVINVGTDDAPTYITIDKVAIYSVAAKPVDGAETTDAMTAEISEPEEEKSLNEDGSESK